MKSLILASLLFAPSASAIFFQWTPADPVWQRVGTDASQSSGFIEFVDPPLDEGPRYTPGGVLDFAFSYGGGTPAFTTIDRMWGLHSGGFVDKLTSVEGSAGFTSGADDWTLTFNFDTLNNPMGNAFGFLRQGDTEFPSLSGRWLRVDNVPDGGGTAGLLAMSLVGLLCRRHRG